MITVKDLDECTEAENPDMENMIREVRNGKEEGEDDGIHE